MGLGEVASLSCGSWLPEWLKKKRAFYEWLARDTEAAEERSPEPGISWGVPSGDSPIRACTLPFDVGSGTWGLMSTAGAPVRSFPHAVSLALTEEPHLIPWVNFLCALSQPPVYAKHSSYAPSTQAVGRGEFSLSVS